MYGIGSVHFRCTLTCNAQCQPLVGVAPLAGYVPRPGWGHAVPPHRAVVVHNRLHAMDKWIISSNDSKHYFECGKQFSILATNKNNHLDNSLKKGLRELWVVVVVLWCNVASTIATIACKCLPDVFN